MEFLVIKKGISLEERLIIRDTEFRQGMQAGLVSKRIRNKREAET